MRRFLGTLFIAILADAACSTVLADSMDTALVRAYQNNPQLNAQRASVRATDENVPQALSGYRPKIAITASAGYQYTDAIAGGQVVDSQVPRAIGATATETLFNGMQTMNRVRAAEGQVSGAREGLRVLEQSVLLAAATVYMDLLRDSAIVQVQRSNIRVLEQTLKQTGDRFKVGEVTRTDVAQSQAQLAAGQTQLLAAESILTTTRSNFRRIIGIEPTSPLPGSPVDRFLPNSLSASVDLGLIQNPNVSAAMFGVDVSFLTVKVNEGALFPTLTLQASAQQGYEQSFSVTRQFTASAIAQLAIPIYQGGSEYSLIRQSKETLAQQRLALEQVRDQVRASIVQAWGQLQAGKSQVVSAQAQVRASEVALNGVREELKAGQRTTLDVLNAQQALVNARIALVNAQHDRVIASYTMLSGVGRLSPKVLNLSTDTYNPALHYQQVRDSWAGIRVPNGR